jgi:trehalose 6-phosphate phosphatase
MLIFTNPRRTRSGVTVKRPSNGAGSPRSVTLEDWTRDPVAPQLGGPIYLFKDWKSVAEKIRSTKSILLFLDFDGTLAPLRRRPQDVMPLGLSLRLLLGRLCRMRLIRLYVISGRTLADLRRLVPVAGVHLLGLHGYEGRLSGRMLRERRLLAKVKDVLERNLPTTKRIWIEDKKLGLAIHYREASAAAVRRASPVIHETCERFSPQIQLLEGKKVWELLPTAIKGKGPAVRALILNQRQPVLPVFVGDDTTDEMAFTALPNGLTIRVGGRERTKAQFYLRNPGEVKQFLERLEGEICANNT